MKLIGNLIVNGTSFWGAIISNLTMLDAGAFLSTTKPNRVDSILDTEEVDTMGKIRGRILTNTIQHFTNLSFRHTSSEIRHIS